MVSWYKQLWDKNKNIFIYNQVTRILPEIIFAEEKV